MMVAIMKLPTRVRRFVAPVSIFLAEMLLQRRQTDGLALRAAHHEANVGLRDAEPGHDLDVATLLLGWLEAWPSSFGHGSISWLCDAIYDAIR